MAGYVNTTVFCYCCVFVMFSVDPKIENVLKQMETEREKYV